MRTSRRRRVRSRDDMAVDAPPSSLAAPASDWTTSIERRSSPSRSLPFLAAAVISAFRPGMPVASASEMIDLLHTSKTTSASATDDPSYVSPLGLDCTEHSGLECAKMGALGYDAFEIDDLLRNCPKSCASSPPPVKGDFRLSRGKKNTYRLNNDDGANDPFVRGSANQYTIDSNRRQRPQTSASSLTRAADGTCYGGFCQDDLGYRSKIGLPCERFEIFDCKQFAEVGFTSEETEDLLSSCPCACKEECGVSISARTEPTESPTTVPSLVPSSLPTISMKPTLGSMAIVVPGSDFVLTLAFMKDYIDEGEDVAALGKALSTIISPLIPIEGPEGTTVALNVDLVAQGFEKSDWALTVKLAGKFSVAIPPFIGGEYPPPYFIPSLATVDGATQFALEDGLLKKSFLEELRGAESTVFAFVADMSFDGFYDPPPTMAPTSGKPSQSPTKSPVTSSPTPLPSKAPVTASPTEVASSEPSFSPTTPLPTFYPTEPPKTCEAAGSRCGLLDILPCCPGDRCVLIKGYGGRCLWVKPTPSPSAAPSSAPTRSPTSSPSYRPSSTPSAAPSSSPTSSPSASPSFSPSPPPTPIPTTSPTSRPSPRPSPAPVTPAPSSRPTFCVSPGDLCSIGSDPCCDRHRCTQINGIGARCIYVEPLDTDEPTPFPTAHPTQQPTVAVVPTPVPTRPLPWWEWNRGKLSRAPTVPLTSAPTRTEMPVLSFEQIDWTGLEGRGGENQDQDGQGEESDTDVVDLLENVGGEEGILPANPISTPEKADDPDSFMNKMTKSTNTLFLAIYIAVAVACLLLTVASAYYLFGKSMREERAIKYAAKKAKRHLQREEDAETRNQNRSNRDIDSDNDIERSVSSMTTGSLVAKIEEKGLDQIKPTHSARERERSRERRARDRSRERERSRERRDGQGRGRSRERGPSRERRERDYSRERERSRERRTRERRFRAAAVDMSDSISLEEEYMEGLYSDEEYGSGSMTTASSFRRKRTPTPNYSMWKKIGGTGRGGALF